MRILAISTWFPFPPDNGAKNRTYYLLKYIGERHNLDLLTLSQSAKDREYFGELMSFCQRAECFPEPEFHPERFQCWFSFFSITPRYFRAHNCLQMADKAKEWASRYGYDAAIAVTLGGAPYIPGLDIPFKVIDEHNVESQIIKRECQKEKSIWRRLRYTPTWIKAEQFERRLVRSFDAVTVVSEEEKRLMQALLGKRDEKIIEVIPNGANPDLLQYKSPHRDSRLLVFTGALTYQPNLDAVNILCREILPRVRTVFPEAKLKVTGNYKGVDISSITDSPGVELTGYVEDIRPLIASAAALVVPLRYGGGTRLKILEAMALGTPVISSPIGAEGIEVDDGINILLGEDEQKLADHVIQAMSDPSLGKRIGDAGRSLVMEHYQWPNIAERFERMIFNGHREVAQNYTRQEQYNAN